jgi:hypothetical protein
MMNPSPSIRMSAKAQRILWTTLFRKTLVNVSLQLIKQSFQTCLRVIHGFVVKIKTYLSDPKRVVQPRGAILTCMRVCGGADKKQTSHKPDGSGQSNSFSTGATPFGSVFSIM